MVKLIKKILYTLVSYQHYHPGTKLIVRGKAAVTRNNYSCPQKAGRRQRSMTMSGGVATIDLLGKLKILLLVRSCISGYVVRTNSFVKFLTAEYFHVTKALL
jgi:hypothetical protein